MGHNYDAMRGCTHASELVQVHLEAEAIATAQDAAALDVDVTKTAAARDKRGWWVHLRTGPGGSDLAALVWVPDTGPPAVEKF